MLEPILKTNVYETRQKNNVASNFSVIFVFNAPVTKYIMDKNTKTLQ